jgi:putative CocE/NonD family hydrolase
MTAVDGTPASRPRTRRGRVADTVLDRLLTLPPPTCDYTVTRGLAVPMRDGANLVADHYRPASVSAGTLLVRGPYGRAAPFSTLFARSYAARGYDVVFQSCRGTYGSDGTFEPMVREVDDGADTVAWLREQPWFGGRFATIGLSYLGFTQWALLLDPPPELAAAVVLVGPHDFFAAAHGTGAFTLNDFLGWSELISTQERYGPVRGLLRTATADRRLAPAVRGLPLVEAGDKFLRGGAPWYRDWVSRRDPSDPFWSRMRLGAALDRVSVPVHVIGGWQDLFLGQTLEQYSHLRRRGLDVALTVGPWTHVGTLRDGAGLITRETLAWLAEHLAGSGTRGRPEPVRVYVTGAEQWRSLPHWPPASTEQVLFLQPAGRLGADEPPPGAPTSTFTYDPADPTPTVGGRLLSLAAGYRDDSRLAQRPDVLAFTGPVLPEPLDVAGVPVVELAHTSDNPHADLFARISEIDPKGRSRNVSDGFVRLDPATPGDTLRLSLDAIAHRFAAGNRIRLLLAGGSHPRWDRNLGTGQDPATSSATSPSHRTITVARGVSRLLLPTTAAGPPTRS